VTCHDETKDMVKAFTYVYFTLLAGICPTCMNSAGSSLFTGMTPWLVTLGIAGVSSAVFLYSIV
jgi:hypothetical protein